MLALMFPGQGSQRPGMGAPWRRHPSWEVVGRLSETTGRDVSHLLLDASPEELRQTRNAQLASYTLSLVALDAARRGPLAQAQVTAMAGHSLGEYTALAAAGAVSAEEGARLVKARGEAMQAAADKEPGTMAAVLGLAVPDVAKACADVNGAWVANDNTPGQVVVAGTVQGVEAAGQAALALGAKRVLPLQVGGAFHSPLMRSAQAPLDEALSHAVFNRSEVPVMANVDAAPHRDGFAQLLSAQLCSPVRWRQSLEALAAMGDLLYVELGPGGELSGMVKRAVPGASRANVAGPDDLGALGEAVAARAGAGIAAPGSG